MPVLKEAAGIGYYEIGTPVRPISHGKKAKFYIQKYRLKTDPVNKRRSISLETHDKSTANNRYREYVAKAVAELAPKPELTDHEKHALVPIAKHVTDYIAHLKVEGCSPKHYQNVEFRVLALAKGCGFQFLPDIKAFESKQWISNLKLSQQTKEHYWKTWRAFLNWACEVADRIKENPLRKTKDKFNDGEIQKTYDRRVISDKEFQQLMQNTYIHLKYRRGTTLDGEHRRFLYRVANETGFRASELAALTPNDFLLAGDDPRIKLGAAHSKSGKNYKQPIPKALAEALVPFLAGKDPAQPVWPGRWHANVTKMMRYDMAGIEEKTAEGVIGFHSFRHSFITRIVNSVDNIPIILSVCRLSTPKLLDTYFHAKDQQGRAAVEAASKQTG